MEDIDGGLHPAVDGQSLDEDEVCTMCVCVCVRAHILCVYVCVSVCVLRGVRGGVSGKGCRERSEGGGVSERGWNPQQRMNFR